MPATTEGVPLIAVTTVRTVRTGQPFTSLRNTAGRDGKGHAYQRGEQDLLDGADDGMEYSNMLEGFRIGRLEVRLVVGEQRSPVDRRDGLVRHPGNDEDHQAGDEQRRTDDQDGDHPIGGHGSLDDLSGAQPGKSQEPDVPADKEAECPAQRGDLVEDDPGQAERGQCRDRQEPDVPGSEVPGTPWLGHPPWPRNGGDRVAPRCGSRRIRRCLPRRRAGRPRR